MRVSCGHFPFHGNCESSQVHLKTEQKIFCRTPASETLRDKKDSAFFVNEEKKKSQSILMLEILDIRLFPAENALFILRSSLN